MHRVCCEDGSSASSRSTASSAEGPGTSDVQERSERRRGMAKTMRAALMHAFGELVKIEEVPIPTSGPHKILRSAIKTLCKQSLTICAGLTIAIMGTAPCRAIDYQPFDFIPAAPGTVMLMGYYEFGTRNELNNTITGTET